MIGTSGCLSLLPPLVKSALLGGFFPSNQNTRFRQRAGPKDGGRTISSALPPSRDSSQGSGRRCLCLHQFRQTRSIPDTQTARRHCLAQTFAYLGSSGFVEI